MLNIMNPPADWSTMKKLIWLRGTPITGGEELTVSGTPPLSLSNSLGKPLKAWEVDVLPKQDLHGYDAPWPAGGSDNLIPPINPWPTGDTLIKEFPTEISIQGYALTFKFSGSYIYGNAAFLALKDSNGNNSAVFTMSGMRKVSDNTFLTAETTYTNERVYAVGSASNTYNIKTIYSYSNAAFSNASFDELMLEQGSTVNSYKPYSNICPIHGTDKLTITTAGKNLCDNSTKSVIESTSGGTIVYMYAGIELKAGITYTFGISDVLSAPNGIYIRKKADSTILALGYNTNRVTATLTEDTLCYFYILYNQAQTSDTWANIKAQLEFGSTATPYTPYLAPSQTVITLPSTVYTATIGSEGGESRWGEVDLGTLTWSLAGSGRLNAFLPSGIKPVPNETAMNGMCEIYKVVSGSDIPLNDCSIGIVNTNRLQVNDSRYNGGDPAEFKAAVTGIKFYYELDTPTTFAVPSVTIPTPTGSATTWATAEDGTVDGMEVTYVGKA